MAKSLKMIIEALLFSSDKPLTVKDIHDCIPDADKTEIKNSLTILIHDYDTLERSFIIKEIAGGFQFRSRPEYGSYILRMFQKTPNRLSRATIETLAIIAYKQPILKSEIERLRGVDVGGILKTLMEKGLVKIMGRKELPGRPLVYGTTKRFLEVFDLKDLSSLPKLKEIKDFAADQYEPTVISRDTPDGNSTGEEPVLPFKEYIDQESDAGGYTYSEEAETDVVYAETHEESYEDDSLREVSYEVDSDPEDRNITEDADSEPGYTDMPDDESDQDGNGTED
ncbi:MAG: SMC-Scp complex subunit ScpB [Desulfatiglans sp.]|jgi:segregation and condensation protein B|nr:SMC-Scp complex subunit ScpB [Desulfatiglans sp.]